MNDKTVLLVDDTELFLKLEETFLQRSGIAILTARNGSEALEAIRDHLPDLVFLDLNMPVMEGDACCRIVKQDPVLKNTPIVMVTTAGRPKDIERCRDAGCDDILLKPINRSDFVATAQKMLQIPVREERYKAKIKIRYGVNAETILANFSADISSGGLYICTDKPLDIGENLQLSFALPDRSGEISCTSEVVWINSPFGRTKSALPPGMGVRFIDLAQEDLHAIRNFMEDSH